MSISQFKQIDVMLDKLAEWQTQATQEGYECVVGALITNPQGAVFVQKRNLTRKMFPGCWDIVGGHVEAGESLFEALKREVQEETGWRLTDLLDVVRIFDWESESHGQLVKKREFDFLVTIEGELNAPQIETEKFTEYRWVTLADIEILKENRGEGDTVIYNLVKQTLRLSYT